MIDVLLVSPRHVAGSGPPIGDHTYTELLLRHPPEGIRYHHYLDLADRGQLRLMRWPYHISTGLRAMGVLPPDMWDQYVESRFTPDLVHIQGFSAAVRFSRASGQVPPLVLGASTGSTSDLCDYLGWPPRRAARARRRKRAYLGLVGAHDSSLRPERAARVLVWSDYARRLHLDEGYVRADQIQTLPPGLPDPVPPPPARPDRPLTLLFVGRDFERKNGSLVVDAFRSLRQRHPGARLLLVGGTGGSRIVEPGIEHHLDMDRPDLLDRIFPQADVLVLPSRAEGFGMVLIEAMASGLAVLGTRTGGIPEIVDHARTGFLLDPANLAVDLARRLDELASRAGLVRQMAAAARKRFASLFTVARHNDRLRAVYEAALGPRSS